MMMMTMMAMIDEGCVQGVAVGEEEWKDEEEEEEDEPNMIHYCEVAMDVKILVGF